MADTYPISCQQAVNGDVQFVNKVTGAVVFAFSTAANGMPVQGVANAITARAGGGQALATALTAQANRVTVVATAGDSVLLPPAVAGLVISVANADAADSMNVYPSSAAQGGVTGGDAINALAANAAFAILANKMATFTCFVTGTWTSNLTA